MNAEFKINGKVIETERLILRGPNQDDLDDLFEYASVDGVGQMAGWNPHKDKEESQRILDMFIKHDNVFAICLKKNNKMIGTLGVEKYSNESKQIELLDYKGREIGFVIGKPYWGNGYVPEAAKAVIDYLFNELDLDFLTCGHFLFNIQSKRVQEKCGFKPYKKQIVETIMGTQEPGILNLLLNPKKKITLVISQSDTILWSE